MSKETLRVTARDKNYIISSVILSIVVFLICIIIFGNAEGMPGIQLSIIFSCITFGISFLTTGICNFYLNIGNKFHNIIMKILYYLVIPIFILLSWIGLWVIGAIIFQTIRGLDLGHVLLFGFVTWIVAIFLIVPYVQALIFLFCTKFKSK